MIIDYKFNKIVETKDEVIIDITSFEGEYRDVKERTVDGKEITVTKYVRSNKLWSKEFITKKIPFNEIVALSNSEIAKDSVRTKLDCQVNTLDMNKAVESLSVTTSVK